MQAAVLKRKTEDEGELKEWAIIAIEEAKEEIKRGEFYTLDQVRKRLGLNVAPRRS
ncbi:hypothetical protein HZB01_02330 [Candidatus Woesearchaeota archaeon]|nr:hypothetical protein [Candidatus Woesearchaeota archaeon]